MQEKREAAFVRRLIASLSVVALVLASCGSTDEPDEEAATTPTAEEATEEDVRDLYQTLMSLEVETVDNRPIAAFSRYRLEAAVAPCTTEPMVIESPPTDLSSGERERLVAFYNAVNELCLELSDVLRFPEQSGARHSALWDVVHAQQIAEQAWNTLESNE